MHLYVLFAQRKEGYPGEFGPEALEVVDCYAADDNPEVMKTLKSKHAQDSTLAGLEWFKVELASNAGAAIRQRLIGTETLAAKSISAVE